jgi:hypothetical protein
LPRENHSPFDFEAEAEAETSAAAMFNPVKTSEAKIAIIEKEAAK